MKTMQPHPAAKLLFSMTILMPLNEDHEPMLLLLSLLTKPRPAAEELPPLPSRRWNGDPRPQPKIFSNLGVLICVSSFYICLNWSSGALVGDRGFRFID